SSTNVLRVVVNGKNASFWINGQKVADLAGEPPEGGSLFGFEVGADQISTVTLKTIQLRELEGQPQASPTQQQPSATEPPKVAHRQTGGTVADCGKGKLILEDKFQTLDPAWGFPKEDPQRINGPSGLTYKLGPNQVVTLLNQADFRENYEVCLSF